MGQNEAMTKVNFAKDKANIDPNTLEHMKIMENYNLSRVSFLKRNRRRTNLLSVGLTFSVLGTYLYSMYAVRQEGFLDDFEEPKLKSG